MEPVTETRVKRTQNISLDDVEIRGLRLLARSQRFGNMSAAVALLIRAELIRLYGVNWQDVVDREIPADA